MSEYEQCGTNTGRQNIGMNKDNGTNPTLQNKGKDTENLQTYIDQILEWVTENNKFITGENFPLSLLRKEGRKKSRHNTSPRRRESGSQHERCVMISRSDDCRRHTILGEHDKGTDESPKSVLRRHTKHAELEQHNSLRRC